MLARRARALVLFVVAAILDVRYVVVASIRKRARRRIIASRSGRACRVTGRGLASRARCSERQALDSTGCPRVPVVGGFARRLVGCLAVHAAGVLALAVSNEAALERAVRRARIGAISGPVHRAAQRRVRRGARLCHRSHSFRVVARARARARRAARSHVCRRQVRVGTRCEVGRRARLRHRGSVRARARCANLTASRAIGACG